MSDKERKPIESEQSRMSAVEAAYIAALGAAKADGIVEESEKLGLEGIASMLGQESALAHAIDYFEALNDNDNAMNGALKVVAEGSQEGKLAAIVFMKYILQKDGMSNAENEFFQKAIGAIQ